MVEGGDCGAITVSGGDYGVPPIILVAVEKSDMRGLCRVYIIISLISER